MASRSLVAVSCDEDWGRFEERGGVRSSVDSPSESSPGTRGDRTESARKGMREEKSLAPRLESEVRVRLCHSERWYPRLFRQALFRRFSGTFQARFRRGALASSQGKHSNLQRADVMRRQEPHVVATHCINEHGRGLNERAPESAGSSDTQASGAVLGG